MHSGSTVKLITIEYNMKLTPPLLCILLCTCCSTMRPSKIIGTYKSTCVLYGFPDLVVNLVSDSTFIYKMPYVEDIIGTWILKRDTLILYSDKFPTQPLREDTPAYKYNKYTDSEGNKDAYLVKGRKLYPVSRQRLVKSCYLQKE